MVNSPIQVKNIYDFVCYDAEGNVKWTDRIENLVVIEGLNDILTKYFTGNTYTAAWYVGLTGATPVPTTGDTLLSHAGWTEVTAYTGSRPQLTFGAAAGGSIDNTASKAQFTINANDTEIGGAFVVNGDDVLYGVGAFTAGNKTIGDGDLLDVTVTMTVASA
jgi:hypothetical protein